MRDEAVLSVRRHNPLPKTLFTEVVLEPDQFRDIWGPGEARRPECDLVLAVLENAVADLHRYRHARRCGDQRRYREACEWVAASDLNWPFSFVNICELLRISPEALRERLLHPRDVEAVEVRAA